MRIAVTSILLVVGQHAARAGDCPLSADDAAAGTGTTHLAEDMDACMNDPACATQGEKFGKLPGVDRAPHGTFLTADGDAGVLGRARTSGDGDDAFVVGGNVHAGWHRGFQACASSHAEIGNATNVASSFGTAFPWVLFGAVAFGGAQEWQARPRLSSPRVWSRRVYTAEHVAADVGVVVWRHRDGATSSVLPFSVTSERREQPGIDGRAIAETVDVGAYRYHAADWQIEVARFEVQSLYAHGFPRDINAPPPAADVEVARFDPLIMRAPLGAGIYAAVSGGWFGASQPLHCEVCGGAVGSLEVGTAAWVAHAERTAQLAIDGRIVIEDRVSAGYRLARATYTLRADAFTALTRTSAAGEGRIVATGGGALGLDLPLAYDFGMSADVEAGRTYYARLDADPTPTPETAARAELRLVRRFQYIPK